MTDVPFNPLDPDKAPALSRIFGKQEVHVRTPEGITPCGRVHHHVTVTSRISTATCVECLRTIATERGKQAASVATPTGEDAVEVARAILAAAGNTGHEVVSEHQMEWRLRNAGTNCARSMRSRYSASLSDLLELHGASDALIADAGRLDCLPLTPDEDTDDEPPCLAMSPTPDTHVPYECEGAAGHEGEHHALKGAVTWESEPDLASRITELEELAADQVDALEKHSRAIADLRTHMSGAQAAIRGLGKQASLHPTTENDL